MEGFSMPAEWAPHERTLMAWPARRALWGDLYEQAEADYSVCARAVARFEPVLMVANPGDGRRAMNACGTGVEVIEFPIDDSWLRDNGPIVVTRADGARLVVDFGFNAWGGRYPPFERDADLTRLLGDHLGLRRRASTLILEGGSIDVDGAGTLITTEECLLDPSRNPALGRSEIEDTLCSWLGVAKVLWAGGGLLEDTDTDGHVDNVCRFAGPGRLLVQTAPPDDANHAGLLANYRRLEGATDAGGVPIEIVPFGVLPDAWFRGRRLPVSYLNFYLANGGVVVPLAGTRSDPEALELLGGLWPGREVVGVPGGTLAFGGGGVHCITQQVPA